MTGTRHWQPSDFVVTERGGRLNVQDTGSRYGYCRVCFGDMQQFSDDKQPRHYNSHGTAKKLGLWGKRK